MNPSDQKDPGQVQTPRTQDGGGYAPEKNSCSWGMAKGELTFGFVERAGLEVGLKGWARSAQLGRIDKGWESVGTLG